MKTEIALPPMPTVKDFSDDNGQHHWHDHGRAIAAWERVCLAIVAANAGKPQDHPPSGQEPR